MYGTAFDMPPAWKWFGTTAVVLYLYMLAMTTFIRPFQGYGESREQTCSERYVYDYVLPARQLYCFLTRKIK